MAQRSQSQKIGALGQQFVRLQIEQSGIWLARNQDEDYGIDLEMELTTPEVSGKIIKIQVKSHASISSENDFISERLSKSFLRYVNECRIPVLLTVVSTSTAEIWYTWLQKWLYDTNNRNNIYDESGSKTLEVNIHKSSLFSDRLANEIISIATWHNNTQKLITLFDLANLSVKLYDDKLSDILFEYIETLEKEREHDHPDIIVDRVIELGTGIWATLEGNKRSQQLFDFIRRNGNKLTKEHVSKLILRVESYSRTGINALAVLYEEFPQHALALKLPDVFKNANDLVYYYCVLRERNIQAQGFFWVINVTDFRVNNYTIDDSRFLSDIMDNIANRGDSAILDYVVYKPIQT
jgi:hypothetical protein